MSRVRTLAVSTAFALGAALLPTAVPWTAAAQEPPPAPDAAEAPGSVALDPGDPTPPVEVDGLTEIESERTASSRTYLDDDGTYTTMLTADPVNYQADDGTWEEIDTSLVRLEGRGASGWHNAANDFRISLPGTLDGQVSASVDGVDLAYQVADVPEGVVGEVDGNAVAYVLDEQRTVKYTSLPTGLKEEVVLAGPRAPRRLDVDVSVDGGTLRLVEGGGAEVVGPDGEVAIGIPAPWAVDADGVEGPARLELTETEAGPRLSVVGDDAWLDAPDRAWPVTLDPDLIIRGSAAGDDCYISSANQPGQNCTATTLRVGYEGGVRRNALLAFPDLEQTIPANTEHLDSYLHLDARSHSNPSGSYSVRVNAVTRDWTPLLNWTKANGSTVSWTSAGGDFDTTTDKYVNVAGTTKNLSGGVTGGFYLSVHEMVNRWLIKPSDNHGFFLSSPAGGSTNDTVDFGSSENATTAYQPALYTRWKFREGIRSSSSYQTFDITDRSSLNINRANLNAVVAATDFDIQGTGQNLTISRYYNGRNTASRGWSWSVGADTELWEGTNDTVTFEEASGADYLFQPKAAGGFWSPPGINAKLTKANDDDYTLTYDKSNTKVRFQRRGDRLVPTETKDRNGNTITYTYTVVGTFPQITKVTDTQGREVAISWASGRITSIEDWTGRIASYTWTGGLLTTARDANNADTTYAYDGSNRLETITTEEGRVTSLTYQPTDSGIYEVIRERDGSVSYTWTFEPFIVPNKMTRVTDPNGHETEHYWSFRDIVVKVHDALGNEPDANEYTENNDADLLNSNVSGVFDYGWSTDGNNNLETIQAPSSGTGPLTTRFRYNTPNTRAGYSYLASSVVDPQGRCRAFQYDPAGNLEKTFDGANVSVGGGCDGATSGAETETKRNSNGTISYVDDPLGNRTSYGYDAAGNLTSIDPAGTWTTTTRVPDDVSRTRSVTDGLGTTTFTYDDMDRITKITYGGDTGCTSTTTCTTFAYDADGNLETRVDNTGTTTFTYDGLNRLRSKTLPGGANACSSGGSAMTLDYDGAGNLISHCDAQGAITYRYDEVDRMVGLAEPGGSCVPGSEVDCVRFQYDADGKRTKVTYPTSPTAVTVDYTYPTGGGAYIKELEVKRGVTSLIDLSYTYASGGSDTQLVRTRVDNLTANVWSYGYDTRNRLCWANQSNAVTTGTCSSPPAGANKYVLDANGNRTSMVTTSGTTTYKYDGANEMCWLYAGASSNACGSPPAGAETQNHDPAGNLTGRSDGFSASYNPKHQPVSVDHPGGGGAVTAVYSDVDSTERVQIGTTYFDNGPLGVMRSTDTGVTSTWTRDNRGGLVSQHRSDSSNERYYYVLDRLDTVIGLIDSSGNLDNTYRYSPHGRMFSGTEVVPNPWRFQSGYQDDDRSVKFGTRFYDTTTGRFTQPDALAGSVWDPMVANRYAFAANDPANRSDPTGYCVLGVFGECDNDFNDMLTDGGCLASAGLTIAAGGAAVAAAGSGQWYLAGTAAAGAAGASYYMTEECGDATEEGD